MRCVSPFRQPLANWSEMQSCCQHLMQANTLRSKRTQSLCRLLNSGHAAVTMSDLHLKSSNIITHHQHHVTVCRAPSLDRWRSASDRLLISNSSLASRVHQSRYFSPHPSVISMSSYLSKLQSSHSASALKVKLPSSKLPPQLHLGIHQVGPASSNHVGLDFSYVMLLKHSGIMVCRHQTVARGPDLAHCAILFGP